MKKSILITSLTVVGLALSSAVLYADEDQPWHMTLQAGGAKMDNDRETRDNDVWWSVGFGRFFGNNFSLDFEYDKFEGTYRDFDTVVPGATYDKWGLSTVGLMGRYHIGQKNWRPYLALCAGATSHSSVLDTGSNLQTSAGLGLQGKIAKHWTTRFQILWRIDHDNQSLSGAES